MSDTVKTLSKSLDITIELENADRFIELFNKNDVRLKEMLAPLVIKRVEKITSTEDMSAKDSTISFDETTSWLGYQMSYEAIADEPAELRNAFTTVCRKSKQLADEARAWAKKQLGRPKLPEDLEVVLREIADGDLTQQEMPIEAARSRLCSSLTEESQNSVQTTLPTKVKNKPTMHPARKLRVYVSMKYESETIDPVYDIIEDAANKVGLELFCSNESGYLAKNLREKVLQDIDDSFIVVCESSAFSWFVAFELAYAINRKPCIILHQERSARDHELLGHNPGVAALYADKELVPYSLKNREGRKNLLNKLLCAFQSAITKSFTQAQDLASEIASLELYKPTPMLESFVSPTIEFQGGRISWDDLFQAWQGLQTNGSEANRPLVLIAPPGGGKSASLADIDKKLRRRMGFSDTESDLKLPVFINLGSVRSRVTNDWPWRNLREDISRFHSQGQPDGLFQFGLYTALQFAGRYTLLLDAIDEFARSNDQQQIDELLHQCVRLAKSGVPVIVTSRTSYWKMFVDENIAKQFATSEIQPFDDTQVNKLLDKGTLPSGAMKNGKLKDWIRSPLMLTFIKNYDFNFQSKAGLFEAWANWVARSEAVSHFKNGISSHKQILSFFGDLAILLAKERTQFITTELCHEANAGKYPISPTAAITSSFLTHYRDEEEQIARSAVFVHALVGEYFVAHRLAEDFRQAVSCPIEQLKELELSQTPLDYLPSSLYGFLADILEERFEAEILKRMKELASHSAGPVPEELMRNLLEYLGKTFESNELGPTAEVLMQLIEADHLSSVIRYNAARALERIHPSGPRPYFDFMSDWGEQRWKEDGQFEQDRFKAWAIRGANLARRKPGTSPAMAFDFSKPLDMEIQTNIANRLLTIIEQSEDVHVQLNCSHALVRWCVWDSQFMQRLKSASVRCSDNHVRENLNAWVMLAIREFANQNDAPVEFGIPQHEPATGNVKQNVEKFFVNYCEDLLNRHEAVRRNALERLLSHEPDDLFDLGPLVDVATAEPLEPTDDLARRESRWMATAVLTKFALQSDDALVRLKEVLQQGGKEFQDFVVREFEKNRIESDVGARVNESISELARQ